jgi:hypothetical protein
VAVMDIEVFVATEPYDDTYDAEAIHPNGHVVSLEGQGHVPTPCDCGRGEDA